jgi:hypothetical protein
MISSFYCPFEWQWGVIFLFSFPFVILALSLMVNFHIGKRILLNWESDPIDAALKKPVSEVYAKLKYTKCESVKAAPRKFQYCEQLS